MRVRSLGDPDGRAARPPTRQPGDLERPNRYLARDLLPRVASGHFRLELGLVGQGLHILTGFGLRPLEEMVSVAELLEHSVYEHGSLWYDGRVLGFALLNPPLRMGAFSRAALWVDGRPLASESVVVRPGDQREPRRLDSLSPESPVTLPVGERTRFHAEVPGLEDRPHDIRLELTSVAIPPRVWFSFTDRAVPRTLP